MCRTPTSLPTPIVLRRENHFRCWYCSLQARLILSKLWISMHTSTLALNVPFSMGGAELHSALNSLTDLNSAMCPLLVSALLRGFIACNLFIRLLEVLHWRSVSVRCRSVETFLDVIFSISSRSDFVTFSRVQVNQIHFEAGDYHCHSGLSQ